MLMDCQFVCSRTLPSVCRSLSLSIHLCGRSLSLSLWRHQSALGAPSRRPQLSSAPWALPALSSGVALFCPPPSSTRSSFIHQPAKSHQPHGQSSAPAPSKRASLLQFLPTQSAQVDPVAACQERRSELGPIGPIWRPLAASCAVLFLSFSAASPSNGHHQEPKRLVSHKAPRAPAHQRANYFPPAASTHSLSSGFFPPLFPHFSPTFCPLFASPTNS